MGQKYSINSAGKIVAERDIYSLGGFIPKGRLGGAIKDETQLSQEGECWFNSGDITNRPDIVIKDNAYLGEFTPGTSEVRTDGITELSGNTLIPGILCWRTQKTYPLCNTFIKDSFIGVTTDVACGPEASTKAFPFGQGLYNVRASAGTLFANMVVTPIPQNSCRGFSNLRIGRGIKLCIPTGIRAQVLWGYFNEANQATYSGTYTEYNSGLAEVNNPVYKIGQIHFWKTDGTAMTPADLEASGAKILGHVSSSVRSYCNGISASGNYMLDNCNVYWNTDDFAFATDRHAMFAGYAYNCDISLLASSDVSVCGMFRNIERLEISRLMLSADYQNVKRDTFISAYDCPLLRVDDDTYDSSLISAGDLVLRRCIVPKAKFQDDVINGNTYEDIDFSYTNEDLGFTMAGYTRFLSSHKQGIYRMLGGPSSSTGFVSHKGNLADTSRLYQAEKYIPLDGDIIEQGSYVGTADTYYEDSKNTAVNRVRTGKPLPTFGAVFPTAPSGFKVTFIVYLGEDFKIQASQVNPTTIETANPYFVVVFGKADDSPVTPSEFIALNRTLRIIDHTKAPEITGSAYVGAGCTVRGDVQLHGDPYVNRLLDVNLWEWGSITNNLITNGWEAAKNPPGGPTDVDRRRLKEVIPVEPGARITCNSGYWVTCYFYDSDGNYISSPGWGQTANTAPDNAAFAGIILKKGVSVNDSSYIEDSDIPLANVKYFRAFKNRRYIVNELDRTSPEDILLGPDFFEQGGISIAEGNAGKPYEELKIESPYRIRLKRPFGLGAGYRVSFSPVYSLGTTYWDAVTKLLYRSTSANMNNALFSLVGSIADSPTAAITPADVTAARLVIEFAPSPRIIVPYGSNTLFIGGPKIRMYDNSVLSRNICHDADIVLQGDAVMGYDFASGDCLCSNGHDDAIIKRP